jgi:hypothetical protein
MNQHTTAPSTHRLAKDITAYDSRAADFQRGRPLIQAAQNRKTKKEPTTTTKQYSNDVEARPLE